MLFVSDKHPFRPCLLWLGHGSSHLAWSDDTVVVVYLTHKGGLFQKRTSWCCHGAEGALFSIRTPSFVCHFLSFEFCLSGCCFLPPSRLASFWPTALCARQKQAQADFSTAFLCSCHLCARSTAGVVHLSQGQSELSRGHYLHSRGMVLSMEMSHLFRSLSLLSRWKSCPLSLGFRILISGLVTVMYVWHRRKDDLVNAFINFSRGKDTDRNAKDTIGWPLISSYFHVPVKNWSSLPSVCPDNNEFYTINTFSGLYLPDVTNVCIGPRWREEVSLTVP